MKPPIIGYGWNKKIMRAPVWNLPAGSTCPGAAAAGCRKGCYALKAQRAYPSVRRARYHNLAWTFRPDFAPVMIDRIEAMRRRLGFDHFRIHEAGDFYSLSYFRDWALIAHATPGVRFFAYTKSAVWDCWRPDNLQLLASEYLGHLAPGVPALAPRFVTVPRGAPGPAGAIRCPGQCDDCGYQCATVAPGTAIWTPLH